MWHFPALGEDNNTPQNNIQAGATLPSREVSSPSTTVSSQSSGIPPNSPPAIAHLPPREGSNSLLAAAHLPLGEGSSSSQVTALLPPSEGSSSPQVTNSPQAGQSNNSTRSVMQGHRHSPRHRATQSSQENSTISWEDNPTATPQ